MTEHSTLDLAALLGAEEPATPEAQANLAEALADALARTRTKTGADTDIDAEQMAAHLEGGLPEAERDRVLEALARDPGPLAELESAQALLTAVQAAPQPRSAARIAAARAILEQAQPVRPERASWLARLGLGSPRRAIPAFGALALASVCALVVIPGLVGPKSHDPAPSASVSAFKPASSGPDGASGDWSGASSDGGRPDGWIAMALSSDDQRYGAARGAASETEAIQAAVASCRQAGGRDCAVSAKIQGQCLSTAAASPQPPVTLPGPDAQTATKAALTACHDAICRTVKTLCPKP